MLSPAPLLPVPPLSLLDGAALFLDFDGTLAPLAPTPDAVVVDDALIAMLTALQSRLDGRVAIVSGRSVATLRDLGFGGFLLAGTHGLEFARPGDAPQSPARLPAIDAVEARMAEFAKNRPGVLVERKSISVGLHYRGAPQLAAEADALGAALAEEHALAVQRGKMLVELRPGGADKGSAVRALMQAPPMAGFTPLFFGDDVTDEEGFVAASDMDGHGVLVGPPRSTAATFSLEQVADVRHYLGQGAAGPG